ncbi:hypothetical protein [Marinospirillum perlucidum]|uniref:hypothetical protein n=1 Tax=Marinospirillum perlucidum TaxID=1982602 RepID=UPI000DF287E5|nr:hypothetical protein [Marinospirillum perlucidum]
MRFSFIGVVLMAVFLTACGSEEPQGLLEDQVRQQIRQYLAEEYRDPDAIRFRNEGFSSYDLETATFIGGFLPQATSFMFCGEVNGKNEFGAYTGNKKFALIYLAATDSEQAPDIDIAYKGTHLYSSYSQDCR